MGVRRIDLLCSMSNEPLGSLGPCRPGRSNGKWAETTMKNRGFMGFSGIWAMKNGGLCLFLWDFMGLKQETWALNPKKNPRKMGSTTNGFNGIRWDWTKKTIGIKPFSCRGNIMRIYDGNLTLVACSCIFWFGTYYYRLDQKDLGQSWTPWSLAFIDPENCGGNMGGTYFEHIHVQ